MDNKTYPSYKLAYKEGRLKTLIDKITQMLSSCNLCPRRCGVNRLQDKKGFCRSGYHAKVYSYLPHFGEEPPISGINGSGTIFFAGCNMRCCYCQNYSFSQEDKTARETTPKELAKIMLELQHLGCHNINLVTPTHVMPQILMALSCAIEQGLSIPLVYNTSGYELPEIIEVLDGIVDIYLPDMRYGDEECAIKYSQAPKYPQYNQAAVKAMRKQTPYIEFDKNGILKKGLIIRHLVLPNNLSGTEKIMRFIKEEISPDTYISLMSQYHPYYHASRFPELNRRLYYEEYQTAQEIMHKYGLYNGWVQEDGGLERFAGVNIKPR